MLDAALLMSRVVVFGVNFGMSCVRGFDVPVVAYYRENGVIGYHVDKRFVSHVKSTKFLMANGSVIVAVEGFRVRVCTLGCLFICEL